MSVCKKRIPALCSKSAIIFLIFFPVHLFCRYQFSVLCVRCPVWPPVSTDVHLWTHITCMKSVAVVTAVIHTLGKIPKSVSSVHSFAYELRRHVAPEHKKNKHQFSVFMHGHVYITLREERASMPNAMPQHFFFLVVGGCSCLCAKPKPWLHGISLVLDLKTLSKNHLLVTWQNVAGSWVGGDSMVGND